MEKWTIDYYLDDAYNLDSNVEIWVVRKGSKSFETNSQADAEWLCKRLNDIEYLFSLNVND